MKHKLLLNVASIAAVVLTACQAIPAQSLPADDVVEQLQKEALASDLAWEILASMTSEIGPRMAGSAADKRAVRWAVNKMRDMGFDRVWTEPVKFRQWQRRGESVKVLVPPPDRNKHHKAPHERKVSQTLAATAIGGSPSTQGDIEGVVIQYDSLAALESAGIDEVNGKIVFLSTRMPVKRDGSGYRTTVINRSRGPFIAAQKGAKALLIRSVGTDSDRMPHTGMMSGSEQGERVPSAALSNPDADNLMIMLSAEAPVEIRMNLDVGFKKEITSYNVLGEFDGSEDESEFILLGAHLDSWDLGTGAIDDGAGVAIIMAAAKLVAAAPVRPRYGIRVVLYANEEQGVYGGKAYAALHELELSSHLVGAESDLGADRIYAFKTHVSHEAAPVIDKLARYLKNLGIEQNINEPAHGGADVGQMSALGMPVIDLNQDASRYFDLHHTANDTLDKVDKQSLRQNVAAWVSLAYLAANSDIPFGPVKISESSE